MSGKKVKIERRDGEFWRSIKVEYGCSRNDNFYAKYHWKAISNIANSGNVANREFAEIILVWKSFEEGTPVLEKVGRDWLKVGRITKWGEVFLGEGMSYEEYAHSPEGLEASKRAFQQIVANARARTEQAAKRYVFPDLVNGGV